jgi:hypothetical protein
MPKLPIKMKTGRYLEIYMYIYKESQHRLLEN